ncbi:MAG TPA: HlyD family efflux transporter periplasmic adaptor subunit, partial [Bacillota bacterium]|nr:HlyD family efflux transporter periplasmic adaptor subunit [Bacillota bacterium]
MEKLKSLWKNLSKRKKALLAAMLLLVFILIVAAVLLSGTPVETAHVSQGPVAEVIKEAGTVESESALVLTAKQTGEIRGLLVEEGDAVSEGDLLLTGEGSSASLDLKSQQSQLRVLQSQYALAQDAANKSRLLYEQGAVSQQEYSQAQAAANQLAAQ